VHIRGAGATTKRKVLEPATPAELNVIAANMPERLRAAAMISAWCALRYGELAELRRKDIDTEQRLIKVRRASPSRPAAQSSGHRGRRTASGTSQLLPCLASH
jgi:integrase